MPLEPLFGVFRSLIDECFAKAIADGGAHLAASTLEIEEVPLGRGQARAEFLVILPDGPVRITWNAVASLWAFSQGAARLSRRMFDGKRKLEKQLIVDQDQELERGLDCLELSRRFCTRDIPAEVATPKHWPAWAPSIAPTPAIGSDDETGLRFFFGALSWIFRHELAHISLDHHNRLNSGELSEQACETEADIEATRRLRGTRKADILRPAGQSPSHEELELEWRAISIGLGLIWVALFELDRSSQNFTHPPVADRLFACFNELGLREDSIAAEILSDIIQSWIAPEEDWSPGAGYATALDAIDDAIFRLHRRLME